MIAGTSLNLIPYDQRAEIYDAARQKFGDDAQLILAMEELSELQKEICKRFRGKDNEFQLADEIADATIMLEQLRRIPGLNELVCKRMDIKVMRLADRVEDKNLPAKAYEILWARKLEEKEE